MKKTSYTTIIACFMLFVLSSCSKKYPEDDKTYVGKSPLARLYNYGHFWIVYGFFKNGADSTYKFGGASHYIGFSITEKNKTGISFQYVYSIGTMNLINNNNQLNIQYTPSTQYPFNPFINENTTWDIEELTMDNLRIKSTINDNNYELRFASQK